MRLSFAVILFFAFIAVSNTQTVYKTPSGTKYHTATCSYVKNVSNSLSVTEARRQGLGPCSRCSPDSPSYRNSSTTRPGLGIKQGEAQGKMQYAVRCKAYTKAGARCKRQTKNVNGYCFQHERS